MSAVLAVAGCRASSSEPPLLTWDPGPQREAASALEDEFGLSPLRSALPALPDPSLRLALWDEADGALASDPQDEPHFLAYDDGRVVYRRRQGDRFEWFEVTLPKRELDALVSEVATPELLDSDPVHACIPGWWTNPITRVLVRHGDETVLRQVIGVESCEIMQSAGASSPADGLVAVAKHWGIEGGKAWPRGKELPRILYASDRARATHWPVSTRLPPGFGAAYRRLRDWSHPQAQAFTPERLEIEMWAAAPRADDLPWPAGLPTPRKLSVFTERHIFRIPAKHYRQAATIPVTHTSQPSHKFDARSWFLIVHREFPAHASVMAVESLAREMTCAFDTRQRMACVRDHAELEPADRDRCVEDLATAAEVGTCDANRLIMMRDGCWDRFYGRCGW